MNYEYWRGFAAGLLIGVMVAYARWMLVTDLRAMGWLSPGS